MLVFDAIVIFIMVIKAFHMRLNKFNKSSLFLTIFKLTSFEILILNLVFDFCLIISSLIIQPLRLSKKNFPCVCENRSLHFLSFKHFPI